MCVRARARVYTYTFLFFNKKTFIFPHSLTHLYIPILTHLYSHRVPTVGGWETQETEFLHNPALELSLEAVKPKWSWQTGDSIPRTRH